MIMIYNSQILSCYSGSSLLLQSSSRGKPFSQSSYTTTMLSLPPGLGTCHSVFLATLSYFPGWLISPATNYIGTPTPMSYSLLSSQYPQYLTYVWYFMLFWGGQHDILLGLSDGVYPWCPGRSLCLMLVAKLGNLMTGHRLQPWPFLESMTQNLCAMPIQTEPE